MTIKCFILTPNTLHLTPDENDETGTIISKPDRDY